MKLTCLLLATSLLSAQQAAGPYWEYVKTESGVIPYAGGCYPDRAIAAAEGNVQLQITHCGTPPAAQTTYRFEWTAAPRILYPSQPIPFTLKATILSNATPTWTLPGRVGVGFSDFSTVPANFQLRVSVGPTGNPHSAGEVFTWDNTARPPAEQYQAPPAWWSTVNPGGQIRLNYLAYGSSTYWWSHVYRLVEPKPKVTGTVSGASFRPGLSPGAWMTILGEALSATTRPWTAADIVNGRLPTSLDGVQVTIDGKPAFIYYISPTQLNVLVPDDAGTGLVRVEVKNTLGTSETATASCQRFAPAAFVFEPEGGKHVIAHNTDGVFLTKGGLISGLSTRPALPDEIFTMYATGLGTTSPATPADRVLTAPAPTANPVSVRIGGIAAEVLWSGKIGSGLYQLNVRVPAGAPSGELPLTVEISGSVSPAGTVITVQR